MNSLLVQLLTIGIAIAVIVSYIQPKFAEIGVLQDEITKTQEEYNRISEVNARLAETYSQLNSIPQSYKTALLTYLPERVDEVRVMKELAEIARQAEVTLSDLSYESEESRPGSGASVPEGESGEVSDFILRPHVFTVNFNSSYEGLKQFLTLIERNNYPLQVKEMNIKPTEEGLLGVQMSLETYDFLLATVNN